MYCIIDQQILLVSKEFLLIEVLKKEDKMQILDFSNNSKI